jgi:hypothetical protein
MIPHKHHEIIAVMHRREVATREQLIVQSIVYATLLLVCALGYCVLCRRRQQPQYLAEPLAAVYWRRTMWRALLNRTNVNVDQQ